MTKPKVFVTSGEGFTGFYCAREMAEQKNMEGHIGTKDFHEVEDIKNMGITVHEVDHNDKSSIEKALNGMDSLLLIPPTIRNKVEVTKHYIDACNSCGVKNVVMISSLGVYDKEHSALHNFKLIEDYAVDAGIPNFCILRAGFYVQNLLLYKQQLSKNKELPAPVGSGKLAPINLKDIAKVSVVLLSKNPMEPQHRNQVYSLTGPESLSFSEMCQRASNVLGQEISFKDISTEEAKKILSSVQWLDPSEADFLLEAYDLVKTNQLDYVSNDFKHICQQPPSTIDNFFKENKKQILE